LAIFKPWTEGAYRRAVAISASDGWARAAMEDDFHHFAVTIRHDGTTITAIEPESIRVPWASCPLAEAALQALVGQPLASASLTTEQRGQGCTHMLDLVAEALAHARRGPIQRAYRIEVEPPKDGIMHARLERDGETVFDWRIKDDIIQDGPLAGMGVWSLPKTGTDRFSPDEMEAVLLLRRASRIAQARGLNLDEIPHAGFASRGQPASCYSLKPENQGQATRNVGSARDFSALGAWPLAKETTG
jgi:hypothetical protein